MPREPAPIQWSAGITEGKMHRVAYQIVDDESMAGHPQTFGSEPQQLVRLQMMDKERTSHHVEAVVAEGKSQSITADVDVRTVSVQKEVGHRAVQDHGLKSDVAAPQRLLGERYHVAGAAGYIQPRNFLEASLPRNLTQQLRHHAHTSEVLIEHPQIPERIHHFAGCPTISIQKFGHRNAFHGSHLLQLFFEELLVVEVGVVAVAGQQLVMRAQFDNTAGVEHGNTVGVAHG